MSSTDASLYSISEFYHLIQPIHLMIFGSGYYLVVTENTTQKLKYSAQYRKHTVCSHVQKITSTHAMGTVCFGKSVGLPPYMRHWIVVFWQLKLSTHIRWQTSTLSKTHFSRGMSWVDFLNMVAYSVFSLLCGIFQFLCSIFRNYKVIARSKNHQMNCLNSMVKLTNTV